MVADLVVPVAGKVAPVQSLEQAYPSLRTLSTSGYADARLTGSLVAKPFSAAELVDGLRLLFDGPRRPSASL